MSEIDNIIIEYNNVIQSIGIEYTNDINNIILSLGADVQSVYSVNNLTGHITLSASTTLPSVSASLGIYSYSFNHNLNYLFPVVSLYDTNNKIVMADVESVNSNSVTIKSVINLYEYKVVAQR